MERCLKIVVDKSEDLVEMLESFNYKRRAGSAGYNRNKITIIPKRKWYWFSNDLLGTQIVTL